MGLQLLHHHPLRLLLPLPRLLLPQLPSSHTQGTYRPKQCRCILGTHRHP